MIEVMNQVLERIGPLPEELGRGDVEVRHSDEQVVSEVARCYHMRAQWDLALMEFIAEADRRKIYESEGLSSTADWLAVYLGIGYMSALKLVEVAVALDQLPKMTEAYREGRVSYDHLRALVRVAGPDNEEDLLAAAEGMTVSDTFHMVKKIEKVSAEDSLLNRQGRWLQMRWDQESRNLLLFAQLPEEQGAKVERAIDSIARRMPEDPSCDLPPTPMGVKRADALAALADSFLSQESAPAQVVVHVEAEALASNSGVAEIEDGPPISVETARRLSCDGLVQLVVDGAHGKPIGRGRAARTVSKRILKELRRRDRRCRFPGCRRRKGLHAHHLKSWADGGATDYDNLVLICETHHVLVHEGGYVIRGEPPKISFERPELPPMKVGPPALRRETLASFEMEFALAMESAGRGP
jgi:uncharacterized protein DUF222/HNH endonuclease